MRTIALSLAAAAASIAAFGASAIPTATSAQARDYAYCLQGRGVGIPGDCSYATYEQCQASASGRGLGCNVNPRFAYRQQGYGGPGFGPQPGYAPPPRRYGY